MPRCAALLPLLLIVILHQSCRSLPQGAFDEASIPPAPDYSRPEQWAALPDREDEADQLPGSQLTDRQADAPADVFFIHPTSYTGRHGDRYWNAAMDNEKLNRRTDAAPIRFQASIFNGVGKVYAPRYRQGHLHLYFTKDTVSARQALDLAYQDVRRAFLYYWEHYNAGRPLIIAAHSQGTNHAERLIHEFFDGQPRQSQLIAAYLLGMPVSKQAFAHIAPCETATESGCIISWRTFKRGYEPDNIPHGDQILVTNPLSWSTDDRYAPSAENLGAVLNPFDRIIPEASDAQGHNGILWASKPHFKGSFLLTTKNYHIGDFNIYYMNVRENARKRLEAYLDEKALSSKNR